LPCPPWRYRNFPDPRVNALLSCEALSC
jgi:hypothetical protein